MRANNNNSNMQAFNTPCVVMKLSNSFYLRRTFQIFFQTKQYVNHHDPWDLRNSFSLKVDQHAGPDLK